MRAAAIALALLVLGCGGSDGDDGDDVLIELTPGVPVSATIGAAGGSLALDRVTLEVPAGALAGDTLITMTPLNVAAGTLGFLFEPEGLTFAQPASLRIDLTADEHQALTEASTLVLPLLTSADGRTEIPAASWEVRADGAATLRVPMSHFTFLRFRIAQEQAPFGLESLSAAPPLELPVGPVFAHMVRLVQRSDTVDLTPGELTPKSSEEMYLLFRLEGVQGFELVIDSGSIDPITLAISSMRIRHAGLPAGRNPVDSAGDHIATLEALHAGPGDVAAQEYRCKQLGVGGSFGFTVMVELRGTWTLPGYRLKSVGPNADYRVLVRDPLGRTVQPATVTQWVPPPWLDPIHCGGSFVGVMARLSPTSGQTLDLLRRYKSVQEPPCYVHSDGTQCRRAQGRTRTVAVLDPVITVGPGAAARLDAAFPCGAAPGQRTLCGDPAPFAPDDYVMLIATLDLPPPLADPVGRYQTAFVFDADGIAANNYRPSPMYPGDFFAGTDRWYEALYTPATGWSLKVTDVRVGPQPVPSRARFVISGHEIALFVPRDELGATPGFRVSTFRHEGDFGLQGGPWELSYSPLLDRPLYPAAGGDPFVLPE